MQVERLKQKLERAFEHDGEDEADYKNGASADLDDEDDEDAELLADDLDDDDDEELFGDFNKGKKKGKDASTASATAVEKEILSALESLSSRMKRLEEQNVTTSEILGRLDR